MVWSSREFHAARVQQVGIPKYLSLQLVPLVAELSKVRNMLEVIGEATHRTGRTNRIFNSDALSQLMLGNWRRLPVPVGECLSAF